MHVIVGQDDAQLLRQALAHLLPQALGDGVVDDADGVAHLGDALALALLGRRPPGLAVAHRLLEALEVVIHGARQPRDLVGRRHDTRDRRELAPRDAALAERVVDSGVVAKHEADVAKLGGASPIHVEMGFGEVRERGAPQLLPPRAVRELGHVEGERPVGDVAQSLAAPQLVDDGRHGQPADELEGGELRRVGGTRAKGRRRFADQRGATARQQAEGAEVGWQVGRVVPWSGRNSLASHVVLPAPPRSSAGDTNRIRT